MWLALPMPNSLLSLVHSMNVNRGILTGGLIKVQSPSRTRSASGSSRASNQASSIQGQGLMRASLPQWFRYVLPPVTFSANTRILPFKVAFLTFLTPFVPLESWKFACFFPGIILYCFEKKKVQMMFLTLLKKLILAETSTQNNSKCLGLPRLTVSIKFL